MQLNEDYKLLFIYNCDYDYEKAFTFNRIEIAHKSGLLLTGELKDTWLNNSYEPLADRDIEKSLAHTTTEAFKKGFYISYDFRPKNTSLTSIVEFTHLNTLLEFEIVDINNKDDVITLEEKLSFKLNEIENNKTVLANKISTLLSQVSSFDSVYTKPSTKDNNSQKPVVKSKDTVNIREILSLLKSRIIAQDKALDIIVPSIIVNQKLAEINDKDLTKTQKTSILIEGSTGVGKTLIVEEIANFLNLPIVIRGITNYSTVGYKGNDMTNILLELVKAAGGDIEKAQKGIVCLDEIDKLGDSNLEMRKGLEQELLSWISGTKILIETETKKSFEFDTTNVTFISLGAFTKMRETKKGNNPIGFMPFESKKEYSTKDYVAIAGMERELMGRFNCIVSLKDLTIDDLKTILTGSAISPLHSFIKLCNIYGVDVEYDDEFVEEIATKAYEERIGARALQRQINKVKNEYIIDILSGSIDNIDLRKSKHTKTLEM